MRALIGDAPVPGCPVPGAPGAEAAATAIARRRLLLLLSGTVLSAVLVLAVVLWPPSRVIPLALGAGCAAYVALSLSPTVLFSAAVVLQSFSGNWHLLGLPIGLDRVLLAAALVALGRDALVGRLPAALRWRPVHGVLVLLTVVAVSSALWAGTLLTPLGAFAVLDRLGLVPFLAFTLAPVLFATRAQRNVLLAFLVGLGGYLALIALLEGLGQRQLAVPSYIGDPSVGLHFGRARGPFLEAVANGLVLFHCAVACAVAVHVWRRRLARASAAVIGVLCVTGTLFTLTRAVWLGTVVGAVAAMAVVPHLRRLLAPALGAAAVLFLLALALVPGLSEDVSNRSTDQRPLWDRYNTNAAAVRIVEQHPLLGVGWQKFPEEAVAHLRQSDDYPLTGVGIEVHNVFLSHAAELGLPGAYLYVVALALAVGGALCRRAPAVLAGWRVGLVAVAGSWLVVAMFGPLSYALPNTLLWLWAGLVLGPYLAPPVRPGRGTA